MSLTKAGRIMGALLLAALTRGLLLRGIAPHSPTFLTIPGAPRISYEIAQEWQTPSGCHCKIVVIDPKQVHFKGLKLLGEQLKDENTQDSFVLVEVYDNLDAVKTWRKSLNKRTRAEQNVLVMHHVGKYMKKPGSTINEFTAYLGGFGKVLLYQTFTY